MDEQAKKIEKVFCKHVEPDSGLVLDWDYEVLSRTGDMIFVKRYDGLQGFFPADWFREAKTVDFTSHLNSLLSEMEDVRRVAEAMELHGFEERLHQMKVELNEMTISIAEVDDGEPGS